MQRGHDLQVAGGDRLSAADDCVRQLAGLADVRGPAGRVFDWPAIESDLGVRLPADYKLLAESFPDGYFRRFVSLWLPDRWPDGRIRFPARNAADDLEAMREYRATGEAVFPYPLFPEPGGLLPWGYISAPGRAMWLTGPADPQEWPVVVATEECDYWDLFDGTACEFLTAVATARYDASGFIEGATIDEQGVRHPMRPIDLSAQPVFGVLSRVCLRRRRPVSSLSAAGGGG
jgi:hypothetical protein